MSHIAEQLAVQMAEMTVSRNRDHLDLTLVSALHELLHPQQVALYGVGGDTDTEVWLTRGRMRRGDLVPDTDPLWAATATLPTLAERPARLACLRTLEMAVLPGPPVCTLLPLGTRTQTLGVIELLTDQPLGERELRTLQAILRLYCNFQAVLDYSERDALTGLLNRKTFDENVMRMLTAAEPLPEPPLAGVEQRRPAGASPLWLGIIDIDHFKQVNDSFGHLIGDEVLLLLAQLMRGSFRHHDQIYRFGGEEFVVLMRSPDTTSASAALERLRCSAERCDFPQVGHITVSVGFTELREGDTPSEAIERSDKALYHVKRNGRNQVADHAELVVAGLLADADRATAVDFF